MEVNKISLSGSTSTTGTSNPYSNNISTAIFIQLSSECIKVNQLSDSVEFIYIETDHSPQNSYFNTVYNSNRKVYKIIASVVDVVFKYSEKIYGQIVPSQEEYYNFD